MSTNENIRDQLESMDIYDTDGSEIFGVYISEKDAGFDSIVGHIEDALMEDDFQTLQSQFMEKYWQEFEEEEENKLCYMIIFKEYTDVIEKYVETHLLKKLPSFSMDIFIQSLRERRNELEGEVFEKLLTFSDFMAFKEMFLEYKAFKEGIVEDLSTNIHITPAVSY